MAVFRVRPQGFQYPVGLTEANVPTGVAEEVTTLNSTGYITIPQGINYVEVLGVAGGGAGGRTTSGGGGGAGGLFYSSSYPVEPGQTYSMIIGAGAAGGNPGAAPGTRGSNTVVFLPAGSNTLVTTKTVELEGGGRGAWSSPAAPTSGTALSGGSGGGGSWYPSPFISYPAPGVSSNIGTGNSGGIATTPAGGDVGGAGGGGAGGQGEPVGPVGPGTRLGGDGLEYSISGSPAFYAAGGGGSGPGGVYAGGSANTGGWGSVQVGGDGTVNRGSGGGGAYSSPAPSGFSSGSGASGVVIVKWSTTQPGYEIN